ncbi:cytochrome-c peroxidase [Trichloromonas sp.]|uniref:cytochrome-c peroxidase n=1 Tax=Trichloromonas sp. TaxID=3069249 RepID=UPI003D816DD1
MNKIRLMLTFLCLFATVFAATAMAGTAESQLGQLLYFDTYLSLQQNQSCASCHHQKAAFADPLNAQDPWNNVVSLGSDTTLNGGRNAPTASYAAFIPTFGLIEDEGEKLYAGGQFWDGRANTLKDQAKGPFLNPVEMAMKDEAAVIAAIADPRNKNYKSYLKLFSSAYGIDLQTLNLADDVQVMNAYDKMAQAIAAFEQTNRFTEFTSKYDYYLAGKAKLNAQEQNGLALFEGKALCSECHPSAAEVVRGSIVPPLFTDFTYDNLGIPKSENPMIAGLAIDYGLGERFITEKGKFRVSTLRNIAFTPPYGHNGFFATLADIVHFYNTAGDGSWPAPEVTDNVNRDELGNLGLTPQEEADLVAFLMTLSDGYKKERPTTFVLPPITPLQ